MGKPTPETQTITRDESLKLLGLFMLAADRYAELRQVEFTINRALGRDGNDQGHISDAIYRQDAGHTAADFYAALRREGVLIAELNNPPTLSAAEEPCSEGVKEKG